MKNLPFRKVCLYSFPFSPPLLSAGYRLLVFLCHTPPCFLPGVSASCFSLPYPALLFHRGIDFLFSSVIPRSAFFPGYRLLVFICHTPLCFLPGVSASCFPLPYPALLSHRGIGFLFFSAIPRPAFSPGYLLLVSLCHTPPCVLPGVSHACGGLPYPVCLAGERGLHM